jgi:predicted nucleic acid-binding Zn ribbon protein
VSFSRAPRRLEGAVRAVRADAGPATALAAVQSAWLEAAGATIAAQAEPVAERGGVVTVACRAATWAQELDLLQEALLERLNAVLDGPEVSGFRFTADAARHDPGGDTV